MARRCALDKEVKHDGHRHSREVHAVERVSESGDNYGAAGYLLRHYRGDEGAFRRWADHFPVYHTVEVANIGSSGIVFFDPRHLGRTPHVFVIAAGWNVVRAGQVVVRYRGEVHRVVVATLVAASPRCLV